MVAVQAFKPPKIVDSSNKNQRPGVNKFYLNIMWEGTNPRLGRTILNPVIGTILKSIQHVKYCFGSKYAYTKFLNKFFPLEFFFVFTRRGRLWDCMLQPNITAL